MFFNQKYISLQKKYVFIFFDKNQNKNIKTILYLEENIVNASATEKNISNVNENIVRLDEYLNTGHTLTRNIKDIAEQEMPARRYKGKELEEIVGVTLSRIYTNVVLDLGFNPLKIIAILFNLNPMKNFHLSAEQVAELREAHRAERNRNAAYKINAIILLGTGWNLKDVREALFLDDETLRCYVEKYRTGGVTALLKTNYPGRRPDLDDKQLKTLSDELDNNIYLTTGAVIEYVKGVFDIEYSASGMRDLLHRLGYTFRKPKLVPGNPDIEAQEEFVRYYEEFMENKGDDVEVLFIDAVHPEHNTMAAYGWIRKGQQRRLKTNSGRQRLNLHGAINSESMEMTVIESESIDRDSTIQLLEMLDKNMITPKK